MQHLSSKFFPALLTASILLTGTTLAAPADRLTFDTLFTAPGLEGPQVGAFKFSPDGSRIAFLKGSPEHPRQFDLWLHDIATQQQQIIIPASSLAASQSSAPVLSPDERARRERKRVMTSGIVSFEWSPAGDSLMIPANGQVMFYRFASKSLESVTSDADDKNSVAGDMINPTLSPVGNKLAYVLENNLYVQDLEKGKTRRLTKSNDPLIRNGVAEFVAAEEIGRDTGFWWSPDGTTIAMIEVDGRPVEIKERYEITGDTVRINREPYPQAGQPNVRLRLGLVDAKSGKTRWIDLTTGLGEAPDFYISRVKWLYDSSGVMVTRQTRDQKQLDVLLYDIKGRNRGTIISEASNTWTTLHNDLIELTSAPAVLWGSPRDGHHRIYRYGKAGTLEGALTPAKFHVDAIISVDEIRNRLYVEGYDDDPRERHLFFVDLDPRTADKPERLNLDSGVHSTQFSPDGSQMIDRYTSPSIPYRVTVRPIMGGPGTVLADGSITTSHPYSAYFPSHVTPEFGTIRADDGSDLYYRLSLPRGLKPGQRVPVLINVYGGPGAQLVTKSFGPLWQQVALARGYAIFSLDNRGSGRRGKAFENMLHNQLGTTEVIDQLTGISWLKSRAEIDPNRIAVYGWSYGGYMALKMGEASEDIGAIVSGAPVTDWRLYDTHYTERFMGMPQANGAAYDKSSVFPELDRLKAPLLLIHGMADDNVLFSHSTKLMAALQQQARPFTVMPYPGVTHSPREPKLQQHLFETIFDFLDAKMGK